ncbi:hypothetical protein QTP88_008444 [Uroleucon formosanum]
MIYHIEFKFNISVKVTYALTLVHKFWDAVCGIGRSPYEAMFDCPANLGVASIGLPVDEISSLKSEEDIECILKSNKDEGAEENVPCTSNLEQVTSDLELVDQRKQNILDACQSSAQNLEKQALKMVKTSNRKYDELSVGTTVRLSYIPDVDRARGSPINVLAVVTEVKDDLYKLCTESGFLKHMYTRTEINPCKANLLDLSTVLKSAGQAEKPLSLREAATVNSISGAQDNVRQNARRTDRQHPSHNFFYKLEKNLRDTCSFSKRVINQQPRRGNAIGEDIEVQILRAYVRANPRTSIRHVSREINISFGVVQKVLNEYGAPAHNENIVRNYLNEYFLNWWIGTYGAVQWPPRSPDLTPLDYFLWGHLKTLVYTNPLTCLLELKNKIVAASPWCTV